MSDNNYTREDALKEKDLILGEMNKLLMMAIQEAPATMIRKGCAAIAFKSMIKVIEVIDERVAERVNLKRARENN